MKNKILIIEDNRDVRENLSEILSLSGYETVTASNGKEGVQAALEGRPDLILCDIMMPELDGYGVLRILSKNPSTEDIPFIFLTAKTELTDIRKGMTLGADDYIVKPFDDVELLDTIEMRLKKRKTSSGTAASTQSIFPQLNWTQVTESFPDSFREGEPRLLQKKDQLYAEGQTCRSVYWISSGKAMATKIDDYSKEVITRIYQAPMILGIISAIQGNRYRETIKALEPLEVMPIRKDDFMAFLVQHPAIMHFFLQLHAGFIAKSDEKLLLQAFGTVRMKLAATLLDLFPFYEEHGKAIIPISRDELAGMAGTAKETIIRCLSEFKDEGLIQIQDSDIIIDSVKKLTDLRY
jgi:DNA-binding response OmpR family regulator